MLESQHNSIVALTGCQKSSLSSFWLRAVARGVARGRDRGGDQAQARHDGTLMVVRAARSDALVVVDGDAAARPVGRSEVGQGFLHGALLLHLDGGLRVQARDDVDIGLQQAGQARVAIVAQVHDQGLVAQGGELGGIVEEGLIQAAHVGGVRVGEHDVLGQVEGGGVERLGDHAGALGARGEIEPGGQAQAHAQEGAVEDAHVGGHGGGTGAAAAAHARDQGRDEAGEEGGRARGIGRGEVAETHGQFTLAIRGEAAERGPLGAVRDGGIALAQAGTAREAVEQQQAGVGVGIKVLAVALGVARGGTCRDLRAQLGQFAGQPAPQGAVRGGGRRGDTGPGASLVC